MDVSAAAQVLSMVLAAVVIVWHQQRTADKLRAEMREELGKLREELGELRAEVADNGQRLARIEGYFGLGMPEAAATAAAGVRAFTPAGQIAPVDS